jgi:signal transduction histidine kinase
MVSTLPLALCAAVALLTLLHKEERQAIARALEANRQTATAVQVTLNRSFAVLAAVAQSPLLDSDNLGPYTEVLGRILPLMPGWHSMLIAWPDGRLAARVGSKPGGTYAGPAEPVSFNRMLEQPGPIVGQLGKGPSGVWAIPLRVPVMRNGKVRYVLTAPLLPDSIAEVLTLPRLPTGWTVVVFDNNGRRIARTPSAGFEVGGPVSPQLAALALADGNEGSGVTHTVDGKEVYTAYLRLPDIGWTVATGIPTEEVTATVTKAVMLYGGGLALSLVFASLAAWVAARRISAPMRELRNAALAVGRAEIPPPTDTRITEIHEVATALMQSAKALKTSQQAHGDALASLATAHQGLIEADRRKDEFIATLAHELRNPLVPVGQAAALLRSPAASTVEKDRNLAVIERQVGHMKRLLDDLLDVSRMSVGHMALRLERLELGEVLRDALGFITARAQDKGLQVRPTLPTAPVYVEGDGLRLQQLFVNLLDNAVKYTPAGGHLHLVLRRLDTRVEIDVVDNGIGLAPEHLGAIFRMFSRVATPGLEAGGLGVGLALARRLAELHQGELRVSSPGLGQGSCFTVTLALARDQAAPATSSLPEPGASTRPRHVVVADDNRDIAFTLQALLELDGHRVRLAFDGQQAVDHCREAMPEVAILDIGMPTMDGYQAARAIRQLPGSESLLLVAVSGWNQAEDLRKALSAGFDKHLTKPADIDELLGLVARAQG